MNIISENTIQAIVFVLALCGLYVLAVGFRYQSTKRRGVRSPFVEDFLRLPGHSERNRRLDLFEKLGEKYNFFLLSSVLLVFSTLVFHSLVGMFALLLSIIGIALSLRQSYKIHTEIQLANLVCDGEEYTGQELNYLVLEGAHVFHDIPFGGDNIDHIVVGFDKVFVVETIAIEKIPSLKSTFGSTVSFDGNGLSFPHSEYREPLERVRERCKFLKARILDNCELDFQVMPVIALPGWYVDIKKQKKADILVINPKRGTGLKAWLGKNKNQAERTQVLDYLSAVARSIPPTSRKTDSSADEQYEFWLSPRYRDRILGD